MAPKCAGKKAKKPCSSKASAPEGPETPPRRQDEGKCSGKLAKKNKPACISGGQKGTAEEIVVVSCQKQRRSVVDADTQTDPRNLHHRPTQTGNVSDSDVPGSASEPRDVSCQTISGGAVSELGTQTEHPPCVDAATEMEQRETSEAEAQVTLVAGGPEFYLEKLLEMSPDKMFTIQLFARKVQVVLQGGRVVVRTGGGFLKLEDFIAKYGVPAGGASASSAAAGTSGGSGNIGTIVRKAGAISIVGFAGT